MWSRENLETGPLGLPLHCSIPTVYQDAKFKALMLKLGLILTNIQQY